MQGLLNRTRRLLLGRDPGSIYLAKKYPSESIGHGSYGDLTILKWDSAHQLKIGSFCSFAADVTVFLGGEHRTDWVTTYPFNVLNPRFKALEGHPHSKGDVEIGNDVWVGQGAAILSGVHIGDGAVIGAFAVVTKNVPPYAIAAGNPAKLVRYRFSNEVIEQLSQIQWWDWPEDRILRAVPFLQSDRIHEFLALVRSGQL
ncbi:CatB-related O-acetyltransferase [Sphingomonas hankyongi]|uniref:CatB-related O-acetyltransferase n=1 Tax=Sphingomonas hankyongi TaxID=2908209 RepID=A0ABT0S2Q6_9SPHN|nr:CatB-related O-acetyltransferase [Sphingomonas hankyongi]MCL6730154.1 CatB-related O-acetyltransferase [Sphingomonas hankyongi]